MNKTKMTSEEWEREYGLASRQEEEMEDRAREYNKWWMETMTSENSFGWQGAYADQI